MFIPCLQILHALFSPASSVMHFCPLLSQFISLSLTCSLTCCLFICISFTLNNHLLNLHSITRKQLPDTQILAIIAIKQMERQAVAELTTVSKLPNLKGRVSPGMPDKLMAKQKWAEQGSGRSDRKFWLHHLKLVYQTIFSLLHHPLSGRLYLWYIVIHYDTYVSECREVVSQQSNPRQKKEKTRELCIESLRRCTWVHLHLFFWLGSLICKRQLPFAHLVLVFMPTLAVSVEEDVWNLLRATEPHTGQTSRTTIKTCKGRAHLWQVTGSSHGWHIEKNHHPHSLSYPQAFYGDQLTWPVGGSRSTEKETNTDARRTCKPCTERPWPRNWTQDLFALRRQC